MYGQAHIVQAVERIRFWRSMIIRLVVLSAAIGVMSQTKNLLMGGL